MVAEQKTCEISKIIEKFGKFQLTQYLLISVSLMFFTMSNINYVFIAGDMNYRCQIDECEDTNSTAEHPSWWPDTNIDRCSTPVLRSGEQVCTNNSFTGELATCDHWIYESNDTVVAELNLACHPWKRNLIGTIHGTGSLIAMIIFGWLSDKIGRKPTFIICSVSGIIGYIKVFATSYSSFVIIEFIEALVTSGNYLAGMVLILEVTGKKHRPISGIVFMYSIYIGESIYAFVAMYVPYWKTIAGIIYGPCILFIVYVFLMNESPRWQIVTGRIQDVKKNLKQIADLNKICINNQELESIDDAEMKEKFNIGKNQVDETMKHIFRSKEIVKRMFVYCTCRYINTLVYYGMMFNAVWLPGNKYLNFFLTTLMSFPGEFISLYLIYKVGRKLPLIVGYSMCGVFCIISAFTPASYPVLQLTVFLFAKIISSVCISSLVMYGMELFPTSVRGTIMGFAGFCTRLANMAAPLTPMLTTIFDGFPFLLFGCSCIISSLLLTLTPETKNLPLFDTINQVERYRKEGDSAENETLNN